MFRTCVRERCYLAIWGFKKEVMLMDEPGLVVRVLAVNAFLGPSQPMSFNVFQLLK